MVALSSILLLSLRADKEHRRWITLIDNNPKSFGIVFRERKAAPPVRWENIDRRVLMRVLGCFDDKNTLRQAWRCLRLVNRHWCSTISGTLRFVRPNYMRLALQDVIEACVTHFSNAVEVDLSNCDLSSGVAQAFGCLVVLPKMRKLSLQGTEYDNSLISKLTSITTLTSLSLRRTSVTHSGLLPLGCLQKLSSLDVSGSKGVTDAGVQCFSSLSQLTSLTLDDCDSITDEGLGHLGLLTALRTLSLNGVWRVSHKGASAFCELRNLTGLHVADRRKRGLWGITDSCTDSISCLDKLRRLHLPPSMSGDGLQQLSCLKHLSSLKWFLQEVLDEDLAVLQSFSSLLSLSLSNASMALSSRMLSDCGLQHLVQVHFLTRLEIRGAHWITAKGIDSLSCMQSLKTLRINHCHRVTAPGFAFVTHLQLLQELDLAGCFALGDDVFKHLSGLQGLKCLHVECCNLLTDDGLEIITVLTTLTQLTVGGSITDGGLDHVRRLPWLNHLGVAWCSNLTGKGIQDFIHQAPQLSKLSIFQCDNVDFSWSSVARCAALIWNSQG